MIITPIKLLESRGLSSCMTFYDYVFRVCSGISRQVPIVDVRSTRILECDATYAPGICFAEPYSISVFQCQYLITSKAFWFPTKRVPRRRNLNCQYKGTRRNSRLKPLRALCRQFTYFGRCDTFKIWKTPPALKYNIAGAKEKTCKLETARWTSQTFLALQRCLCIGVPVLVGTPLENALLPGHGWVFRSLKPQH